MNKLTKLQLDYLKDKLKKIADDKMQYIIEPEYIDNTKKIKLIADKKVELKSLKAQLKLSTYSYWYDVYDFTKYESNYNKEYEVYNKKLQKISDCTTRILDKVILSGLDIEEALKELEALQV